MTPVCREQLREIKKVTSLKSTHLIVGFNAVSEEKSTVLLGKQFQMLTNRSVKMKTRQCLYTGV